MIMIEKKGINRIKVVLAEQGKTNRWLAGSIGKNEATVSRWCSNKAQPSVDVFRQIAEVLGLNLRKYRTKKSKLRMNLLLSTLQKQATQRQITRKCFVY